jgi:hypothetical protein
MKPRTVHKCWPNAGLSAPLTTDLPLPTHFEKTIELIEPSKITEDVILGPEPQRHIDAINKFVDAGFDHVYVHQIGPKQEQFFRFYSEKVLPEFGSVARGNTSRMRRHSQSMHSQSRSLEPRSGVN